MSRRGPPFSALIPGLWLAVFFALPFLLVAKLSFSHSALAIPPYAPRLELARGWAGMKSFVAGLDATTYRRLAQDPLYVKALLSSLGFAALATGSYTFSR